MYYTFMKNQRTFRNITFEDMFAGNTDNLVDDEVKFITKITEEDKPLLPNTERAFLQLGPVIDTFLQDHPNYETLYDTFRIPKRSGGFRTIEAPQLPLTQLHHAIKTVFDVSIKALPHDSAHAYVRTRSTVSSIKVHQRNNSKWFLKLDLKDFFPSCNFQFIYNQLVKIFPFTILIQDAECDRILRNIIKVCLRNDKLPQGTKLSPLITNLIMVPIDYKIRETLGAQHRYTRYADDLLISSRIKFDTIPIINTIKALFTEENAPFTINDAKTRFGSSAGRNWNLGVMLNKDNSITIGHKTKERFRAAIDNFIRDSKNPAIAQWPLEDVHHLQGLISYYKMVEPTYVEEVIRKYNSKHSVNLKNLIKAALNRAV